MLTTSRNFELNKGVLAKNEDLSENERIIKFKESISCNFTKKWTVAQEYSRSLLVVAIYGKKNLIGPG